jgi:parallel beta-helix repeat protein
MPKPYLISLLATVLFSSALGARFQPAPAVVAFTSAIQIVSSGESIQAAIDRAPEGGWVLVKPGTYVESGDATNGLNLTRSVHLVGLSTPGKPVTLRNAGSQANGIAAVPAEHTDCMRCHSTLAPPFTTHPWVEMTVSNDPVIDGLTVAGITIEGFTNNGLFTRNVANFRIVNVHSVDNANYGIFPTLSQDGIIAGSSATGSRDSGIWIETSKRVTATGNTMQGNVIGLEISNSEDIVVSHNQIRDNSIGVAILYLRHLFAQAPDMQRVTFRHNAVVGNNRPNFAEPGTLVSALPRGVGLFLLGADRTLIADNVFNGHGLAGLGIIDYCVGVTGTSRDCTVDAAITPAFLLDTPASDNIVVRNRFVGNGLNPPTHPFAFAAGDIGLLTLGDHGNCFAGNTLTSFFSLIGGLPDCQTPAASGPP